MSLIANLARRRAVTDGMDTAAVESRITIFLVLFMFDAFCRAFLTTLVPQQIYVLLGSAFAVSLVYFVVAFVGLITSLTVPALLYVMARRHLLTAGCIAMIASTALMAIGQPWSMVAGLMLQMAAAATTEILLNLYLLEQIPRRSLVRFEPRRLLFVGCTFLIGPWLGVLLHYRVMENLTYGLVALSSLSMLLYFWRFRLTDGAPPDRRQPVPRPLKSIPRFFRQPRLVLALTLAVGRNGWWTLYYVYTPILVAAVGFGPEIAGVVVSSGMLSILFVRTWGRLGEIYGIRRLMMAGFIIAGVGVLCVAATIGWPAIALVLLCIAALGAGLLDGAGNVPFLRAVHPYERAPMTAVYMTYRHVASIAFPGLFAIVLTVAPLAGVYAAGGVITLIMAGLSRHIPRRL